MSLLAHPGGAIAVSKQHEVTRSKYYSPHGWDTGLWQDYPPSISSGFPKNLPLPIHTHMWRPRHHESKVSCPRMQHRPGLKLGPLNWKSISLTSIPLHLPQL